ncbi:MAG: cytochrome C oxidase subunit IV family protein [Planctomycetota bacterium]|jgi:cytochrome c oxidase subunit 4
MSGDTGSHILPLKTYLAVFGALCVLTVVTVMVAKQDFGAMNTVVAVGIATIKAVLVVLYFMHLRYAFPLIWILAIAGLVFFIILVALTMADVDTRPFVPGWGG